LWEHVLVLLLVGTNRFATRCLEVINRLLGPPTHPMPQGIPTEGDQLNRIVHLHLLLDWEQASAESGITEELPGEWHHVRL
jgi:hypothetical protein